MRDGKRGGVLSGHEVAGLTPSDQRDEIERWFRSRHEDPAVRAPYSSADGGYVWIWGGPSDAEDELRAQFGDLVPEDVIAESGARLERREPLLGSGRFQRGLRPLVSSRASARTATRCPRSERRSRL